MTKMTFDLEKHLNIIYSFKSITVDWWIVKTSLKVRN